MALHRKSEVQKGRDQLRNQLPPPHHHHHRILLLHRLLLILAAAVVLAALPTDDEGESILLVEQIEGGATVDLAIDAGEDATMTAILLPPLRVVRHLKAAGREGTLVIAKRPDAHMMRRQIIVRISIKTMMTMGRLNLVIKQLPTQVEPCRLKRTTLGKPKPSKKLYKEINQAMVLNLTRTMMLVLGLSLNQIIH